MENQKLCMSCMHPLSDTDTVCPHCHYTVGKANPTGYLPAGHLLNEHYTVGRALGSYGDACIYVGYDKMLKNPVFIREFFPVDFTERSSNGDAVPVAGKEDAFASCRDSFYTNIRTLAKLKELPCLLPLYDIFTTNKTVYAVYDFCEGRSLSRELKAREGGRIPWSEVRPLFMQLMTTLTALHRAGIHHLAISPDTIWVGTDGKFRLRGFAIPQARTTGSCLAPRLASGYAAPEQYDLQGACSAAADVYGLAATIFRTITGNQPPDAPHRVHSGGDLFLPAEVANELPENVGLALFNALQTDTNKRLQTIDAFRDALSDTPAVNALLEEDEPAPQQKKNHYPLYIGITVFVVLALVACMLLMFLFPQDNQKDPLSEAPVTTSTSQKTTTTYSDPINAYSIPNLLGKNYFSEKNATHTGNFKLELEYMKYDPKKVKGEIISQDPKAGTSAEEGATIKVVISMGAEDLTVPDIAGWPQEYATKYLEALGFKVEVMTVNISEYEKGVSEGTDPVAGTKLGVGDTVTLRVSNVQPEESTSGTAED